ncbi:MAG: hypothetical protein ARM1_0324 [Candidatus Micrarchaeota archaeon]|nr:MAG: hypothetical protein ARM1_0324 [Candidatus Micrarchaeota archaeon]
MRSHDSNKGRSRSKRRTINTNILYILLILVLILYFILRYNSLLLAILSAIGILLFILILIFEIYNIAVEEGLKKAAIELIIVSVVIVLLFYGLSIFTGSRYPLDVVPSCSMLPNLHRGDIILINRVSIDQLKAPIINITGYQYRQLYNNLSSYQYECVYYKKLNNTEFGYRIEISDNYSAGFKLGLYNPYSKRLIYNSSFYNGFIGFECTNATRLYINGSSMKIAYLKALIVNNITIYGDRNNSIIVYSTTPNDTFYQEGATLISHRVYAILRYGSNYSILTKGDNNPGLDQQYGNYPVNYSNYNGKVVYIIPYLGYLKLLISGVSDNTDCNSYIKNATII